MLSLLHCRVTIRSCAHTPATTTRGGGYEWRTHEGCTARDCCGPQGRAQPPLTVVHGPPCLCVQFCPGAARTPSLCFPTPLPSSEVLHSLGLRLRRGQHSLTETVLANPGGGHKGHLCPGLPRQCWASEQHSGVAHSRLDEARVEGRRGGWTAVVAKQKVQAEHGRPSPPQSPLPEPAATLHSSLRHSVCSVTDRPSIRSSGPGLGSTSLRWRSRRLRIRCQNRSSASRSRDTAFS